MKHDGQKRFSEESMLANVHMENPLEPMQSHVADIVLDPPPAGPHCDISTTRPTTSTIGRRGGSLACQIEASGWTSAKTG